VVNIFPNDPRVQDLGNNNIGICLYDTITLDAGNPGFGYRWSNGATTQTIDILTPGITMIIEEYQVNVVNLNTGCDSDDAITAYFTPQNCSYGINEYESDNRMLVYPNPSSDGLFNVSIDNLDGKMKLEIYTSTGKLIRSQDLNLTSGSRFDMVTDLRHFAAGIYIIKLTGQNEIILKRVIYQK
jgi:hypothetical protein